MNKAQKEVIQAFLDNEKATLKQIEETYQEALDEIGNRIQILKSREDADMQHVIYQIEYQNALKRQVQEILDQLHEDEYKTVSEYLKRCYEDGYVGTLYDLQYQGVPILMPIDQAQVVAAIVHETKLSEDLYSTLGKDVKELQKKISSEISRGIANGQMYSEIARNISKYAGISKNNAMRIARTEGHRIQCKSTSDAQWKAKEHGADIVKKWDATLDSKTRPEHAQLDGQIRELEEYYEVAGYRAMEPSGFGVAAMDINCRCQSISKARWLLDADETKYIGDTSQMTDEQLEPIAKKLGMSTDELRQYKDEIIPVKAKNYEDFKQQYDKIWKFEGSDLQKEAEARIAGYKNGDSSVRSNVQKKNPLEKDGKSSTIGVGNNTHIVQAGNTNAGVFVDTKDDLFIYAKKIKPLKGFDDFVCHANSDVFLIYDGEYEMKYTPKEFAELIRQSKDFHNKPIRIISCRAGAKSDGAAQQLANELGVNVLAPTETVTVDDMGRMFVSDNDVLTEMWIKASDEEKKLIKETGEWIPFEPRKG